MNYEHHPLTIEIEDNRLTISIGIETLAYAVAYSDNQCDEKGKAPIVIDPMELAKAIKTELEQENEVGENPVHTMIDEAVERAIENGGDFFDYTNPDDDDETYEEGTLRSR